MRRLENPSPPPLRSRPDRGVTTPRNRSRWYVSHRLSLNLRQCTANPDIILKICAASLAAQTSKVTVFNLPGRIRLFQGVDLFVWLTGRQLTIANNEGCRPP